MLTVVTTLQFVVTPSEMFHRLEKRYLKKNCILIHLYKEILIRTGQEANLFLDLLVEKFEIKNLQQ